MVTLGTHSVVVRRAVVNDDDDYGNPVLDWDAASSVTVTGCSMQPVLGTEVTVGRETVVTRWQLFGPATMDLLATDRVEYEGGIYEVDGDVQRWDFPPLSHVTALLRLGITI